MDNYTTRPLRRQPADETPEDFSGNAEASYLDEARFIDEAEPFDVYRHFHPGYSFNDDALGEDYVLVAKPKRRASSQLQPGDVVLLRLVLSGRTVQGVVSSPELVRREDLSPYTTSSRKSGYYVQVNADGLDNGNEQTYIRVADDNSITPSNLLIVRRSQAGNRIAVGEEVESAYAGGEEDYTEDDTAPALLGRETSPARETLYVNINLGLGRECTHRERGTWRCLGILRDNVEPKTGIFIPGSFTATPQIDLLIYLHGHKTPYVTRGHDQPIDQFWNPSVHPEFAFRDIVNASGRNLILVAPTLGTLSQPGNLTSNAGFTSFINQVLLSIATYCTLYEGRQAPTVRNIILAAHSGGGSPMRQLALLTDNPYTPLITECWGFDSTYDRSDRSWYGWAQANPSKSLYLFSIANSSTATNAAAIQHGRAALSNIHLTPSSTRVHNNVPQTYLPQRLAALAAASTPAPTESYDEGESCGCGCEGEEESFFEDVNPFAEDVPSPLPIAQPPLMVRNVPFAPAPAAGTFWPLRTSNRNGRLVSYTTTSNTTIGREGRKFLAHRDNRVYKGPITRYYNTRQNRWHVGIDLFANIGDEVVACEAGTIIDLQYFYKASSGQSTYGILVEHAGCLVNYGEVTGNSLTRNRLRRGDTVTAGQVIGFVSDTGMLHFETYALREDHQYHNIQWWNLPETPNAPTGLLNPTQYLLALQEHGNPLSAAPAESIDEDYISEDANTFCTEYGVLVSAAQLRQQIADAATNELTFWRNAPHAQLLEGSAQGRRRITSYWANIPGAPAHTVPATAWSAVFVSTCVKLGADALGVTPVPLQLSAGHFHYAKSAYNRRFHTPPQAGYYWAYDPADRVLQVGDIIVKERKQPNGRFLNLTFDDLRTRDGASTHGDIVVSLQASPGHALVIGGNVSNSVRQSDYILTADGKIDTTQAQNSGNRVFAVLSLMPLEGCIQPASVPRQDGTMIA